MQTLIQVFCKGNTTSLRQKIAADKTLEDYGLFITEQKSNSRPDGWLKLYADGSYGAMNVEWDSSTKILTSRIINKGKGKPDKIAGIFITYLLGRYPKIVNTIQIIVTH